MTIASANLNPILARWLGAATVETAALDCHNCTRPAKCCDFQPFVANFLLGALLAKGQALPPSGAHFHYTPLGLVPSRHYRDRHAQVAESARGEDLLCAFFDRQLRHCSIWNERPGECSTYLCVTPTAARQNLSERSFALEAGLSQMALAYQGYSGAEISQALEALNQPPPDLVDSVEAFALYLRTWDWAQKLTPDDVVAFLEGE